MNSLRIRQALDDIEFHETALKWLEEFGKGISERGSANVSVDLHHASACPGSKEAAKILSSYAFFELPNIVEIAARSCRNTIDMAHDAIREEANK